MMDIPLAVRQGGPVLVTGAAGFLGGNLVHCLREHGFAGRALVRRPPRGPQWEGVSDVEFFLGDVRAPDDVLRAMVGVRYVLHAAALTEPVPRPRHEAFRVNVEGTRNVCEAALRAGVQRLVFTSSVSTVACGTADAPATEASPYNLGAIRAPYYASKRLAESVVRTYAQRGLETLILCPTYIIGPRDAHPTTNWLLLQTAWSPFPVLPPGGMNVLDVREAALAHVRALWKGEPGQRYLLAGAYWSYPDLARLTLRIVGRSQRIHVLPRWSYGPGSFVLALASAILPRLPEGISLPNFQYGFVPFHVSGARANAAFGLRHRPVAESVYDTLAWFRRTGLAPWLPNNLRPPE
jgi:dihydroflavonol-4-reductase